jgi:hypothetical protein
VVSATVSSILVRMRVAVTLTSGRVGEGSAWARPLTAQPIARRLSRAQRRVFGVSDERARRRTDAWWPVRPQKVGVMIELIEARAGSLPRGSALYDAGHGAGHPLLAGIRAGDATRAAFPVPRHQWRETRDGARAGAPVADRCGGSAGWPVTEARWGASCFPFNRVDQERSTQHQPIKYTRARMKVWGRLYAASARGRGLGATPPSTWAPPRAARRSSSSAASSRVIRVQSEAKRSFASAPGRVPAAS